MRTQTTLLPYISSLESYRKVYRDEAVWFPAMRAICARHGLDVSTLRRTPLGSHIVFRTDDHILKLFCDLWADDFTSERAVLEHVRGLPIPELIAHGKLEDWPYIIMSPLPGIPAMDVWGHLRSDQRLDVVRQVGELMRKLHNHPPLMELATDWNAFLRECIAGCSQHHGVEEPLKSWILERVEGFSEPPFDPVLLSSDVTNEHILLSQRDGHWWITGFIDFGDAMMGHPHYEFIAPLACLTIGHPALSRALVESYGLELTPLLTERLTTYCLLHEFARLDDFLGDRSIRDGSSFYRGLWGDL